eukprot:15484544-Alexandrium_andersonii.AAC.1
MPTRSDLGHLDMFKAGRSNNRVLKQSVRRGVDLIGQLNRPCRAEHSRKCSRATACAVPPRG